VVTFTPQSEMSGQLLPGQGSPAPSPRPWTPNSAKVAQGVFSGAPNTPGMPGPSNFADGLRQPKQRFSWADFIRGIIFGLINGVVLVPVMIGFAQIIFRDPFFEPKKALLVKAVLFSCVVHQTAFGLMSTLPFAVGQVQDAGLIFLSAMATSVVSICKDDGVSDTGTIATTLILLSSATTLLGLALILTGYFKLAALVQYLPQPVVGGYLAFIGMYCAEAGLQMMANTSVATFTEIPDAFTHGRARLVVPGVATGLLLYGILRRFRHFAVLPCLLIAIPVCFFVVMLALGLSLDDVRETGWVDSDTSTVSFYDIWPLFDFAQVHWKAFPAQLPTWFAMYFVVAFSSSLDVAAIQLDLGKELDFNHELITVGVSNLLSGVTGGYTGSYIFSQTIFTMRTGLKTRVVCVVIILCEAVMFVLPFSILAYIPRMFFGALLTFIGVDLIIDHLVESFHKMGPADYVLAWLTFLAINLLNLELGMLVGIALATLHFVLVYARRGSSAMLLTTRSRVFRAFQDRQVLDARAHRVVALQLHGYLFFGSAVRLLEEVKGCVVIQSPDLNLVHLDGTPSRARDTTGFLVLDFSKVTGLDATAAGSCFRPLGQVLTQHSVRLVLTGVPPHILDVLTRQGVIQPAGAPLDGGALLVESLDLGLEHCEEALLREHGGRRLSASGVGTLRNVGEGGIVSVLAQYLNTTGFVQDDLDGLEEFFTQDSVAADSILFAKGDSADTLFFVQQGEVELLTDDGERLQRYIDGGVFGDLDFFLERPRTFSAIARTDSILWRLSSRDLGKMSAQRPDLSTAVQRAALRSLCLSASTVFIGDAEEVQLQHAGDGMMMHASPMLHRH